LNMWIVNDVTEIIKMPLTVKAIRVTGN